MHKITFTRAANYGFGREFDIVLNSEIIGTVSKADDYASCEYCTTGLEIGNRYIPFENEWGRSQRTAQKDIARELRRILAALPNP